MKQQRLPPEMPSTAKLRVRFLGTKIPYADAMDVMKAAMARVDDAFDEGGGAVLLLLEHRDTITTTRLHKTRSFLADPVEIEEAGIEIVETDRGGDVTFHGLGQLVGYLILRLPSLNDPNSPHAVDLQAYVRALEDALLSATIELGLPNAHTIADKTGIWLSDPNGTNARKLAAIGVGVSKGVTRHGFAMNISTNLEKFAKCIVPCGLTGYGITSFEREQRVPPIQTICETIARHIAQTFHLSAFYEEDFEPTLSKVATHEIRSHWQGSLLLQSQVRNA